jgi:hypothetical protein
VPARKRKPRTTSDVAALERARVEVMANGKSVAEAARIVGRPRTTISGWLRGATDEPDKWEPIRDQKRLEAIELAWDGFLIQLKATQDVPHNVFSTKDGLVVVGPPNPHAAAQIVEMLGKTLERLAGIGVTPGGNGEGADPSAKPGESVYRVVIERREGAAPKPVSPAVGVRQLP